MGASRVSPSDTFAAFSTEEGFKATAKRLGVSPNTLRGWWIAEFGQEAFDARGKRLQAKAASTQSKAMAGKPRTIEMVSEPCTSCGRDVSLNVLQRAKLKQILCTPCDETARGVDCRCPVCGFGCVGEKGLSGHMARPQHGDVEAHAAFLRGQENQTWEGKIEGPDFVRCLLCGHRGVRIDRHLQAGHEMTVEAYRDRFPDADVQAGNLRSIRSTQARQMHQAAPRKGVTKMLPCSSCGVERPVGLTFAPAAHETRCPTCVEEERFSSKVEGEDFVVCQACGHRAESLVSHIRSLHPELEGHYTEIFPGQRVLSQMASEKSPAHREALSKAANPWSKGLTKATSPAIAASALARSPIMKEIRSLRFWRSVDLIELTQDQLEPFKLKNGKVSVGKAMAALGHAFVTIKRECEKHGLEVAHRHVQQALCMELLSQMTGFAYEVEWSPEWAVNEPTGYALRYDGYFPQLNLVVEFHGAQHFQWPNWTGMSEETFCQQQERDRLKENLIQADPTLRYFLVREDEPYTDEVYLRGRLIDEGVLESSFFLSDPEMSG